MSTAPGAVIGGLFMLSNTMLTVVLTRKLKGGGDDPVGKSDDRSVRVDVHIGDRELDGRRGDDGDAV